MKKKVIDHLDAIKKDSKLAREAIRWLENQFKQGNRFLRAQTQNEKVAYQNDGGAAALKKKDFDKWMFYQLVDCCKYFEVIFNIFGIEFIDTLTLNFNK